MEFRFGSKNKRFAYPQRRTKVIRPFFNWSIFLFDKASDWHMKISVDVLYVLSVQKIQAILHLYIDLLLKRRGERRMDKTWSLPSRIFGADEERQSQLSMTV